MQKASVFFLNSDFGIRNLQLYKEDASASCSATLYAGAGTAPLRVSRLSYRRGGVTPSEIKSRTVIFSAFRIPNSEFAFRRAERIVC